MTKNSLTEISKLGEIQREREWMRESQLKATSNQNCMQNLELSIRLMYDQHFDSLASIDGLRASKQTSKPASQHCRCQRIRYRAANRWRHRKGIKWWSCCNKNYEIMPMHVQKRKIKMNHGRECIKIHTNSQWRPVLHVHPCRVYWNAGVSKCVRCCTHNNNKKKLYGDLT